MEDLKKRVTCPQCGKLYQGYNSRLLPCLHTFCADCLRELPVTVRVSTPSKAQEESCSQAQAEQSTSEPPSKPADPLESEKTSTDSDTSLHSRSSSTEGSVCKYIECPTCHKQCPQPEKGVDGFQSSLIVSDLTSTYKSLEDYGRESGPRCGHCVDALLAVAYCYQCHYFICERCRLMHLHWARDYEGHQVVSMENLEQEEETGASPGGHHLIQNVLQKAQEGSSSSLNIPSFLRRPLNLQDIPCYHHSGEKIKFYCPVCRELLCHDCYIVAHREHPTVLITSPVLADHRSEMSSIASTLGDTTNQLNAIERNTTTEKEALRKRVGDIRESILSTFKALEDKLKSRKEELLSQLNNLESEPLQKLESREREIHTLRDQVTESKTYIEENLSHTGPTAMLSVEKTVVDNNTSLSSDFASIPSLEKNPRVQFSADNKLLEQISSFGDLRTLPSEDAVCVGPPNSYSPSSLCLSLTTSKPMISDRLSLVSSIYPLPEYSSSGSTELEIADRHSQAYVEGSLAELTIPIVVSVPRVQGDAVRTIDNITHPMGLTSANSLVLCKHGSEHEIVIMSHQGTVMRSFGQKGQATGELCYPQCVAMDSTEQLFVTESNHRIQVFDSRGTWLKTVGSKGNDKLQFRDPCGITIGANRRVFVCERSNYRIQVLNSDLSHYKFIGKKGKGQGEFNQPTDIAIDSRGLLYVVDSWNHRIQVLTQEGVFVRSIGTKGDGKGQLKSPSHICIDPDGFVFVTELRNERISMFTIRGEFVKCFGGKGEGLGQLSKPSGIAVDLNKNLYVSDYGNDRIQVFK